MTGDPAHDYGRAQDYTARCSVEPAREYLTMPPANRYPSVPFLHAAAKKRLPKFSYDYVNGPGRVLVRIATAPRWMPSR